MGKTNYTCDSLQAIFLEYAQFSLRTCSIQYLTLPLIESAPTSYAVLSSNEVRSVCSCADPDNFVRGSPKFDVFFFLVEEGREDPNTTISGPSSARQ